MQDGERGQFLWGQGGSRWLPAPGPETLPKPPSRGRKWRRSRRSGTSITRCSWTWTMGGAAGMTTSLTSMKVELGWAGLQTPHRKRCGLWGPGVGPRYSHTHPSHAPGAPGLSALSFPPSHIYGAPLCWPLGVTRTGPVPVLGQLRPIGDQASNILGASGEEQQPSLRWGSGILKNQATSLRRSVGPAVWGEGYLKVPARGLQGVWGMGALLQPPLHKLRAGLCQQWRKAQSSPYAWRVPTTRPHWPSGSRACRRPTQPWPRSPWSSVWQGPRGSSWRPPQGWRSRPRHHPRARKTKKTVSSSDSSRVRAEPELSQGHGLRTGVKA